jgi:hypothetical protein
VTSSIPRSIDRRTAALVAGIASIAIAGAIVGGAEVVGGGGDSSPAPALAGAVFHAGQEVPVSFGVIEVNHIDRVAGLTGQQVNGSTHFPSYVPPDKMSIDVSFMATNLRDVRTAAFDPRSVTLRLRSGKDVPATSGTLGRIDLQPAASVTGRMTFVVPRGSTGMKVAFRDPGASTPVLIDLGNGSVQTEAGSPTTTPLFPGFHNHG